MMAKSPVRKAPAPPSASADMSAQIDRKVIGARLREARKAQALTLMMLSARSGIAVSTISKAERGDIALTYDKFAALAHALELGIDALFERTPRAAASRIVPTFTASDQQMVYDTPNYEYHMLASELTGKRMVPMRGLVRARALTDFPDYIRHSGEEFVFLLKGSLELRFETGATFKLKPGDSLYFDSAVGHVYLSTGKTPAEVLVCCVGADAHRPADAITR